LDTSHNESGIDWSNYLTNEEEIEFNREFEKLITSWDFPKHIIAACNNLCGEQPLSPEDAAIIREHYHHIGNKILGLQFPLLS